jgi:putative transposase
MLCGTLLECCSTENWDLQAWCAFPNHYHLIASSDCPGSLRKVISTLHSLTAHSINKLDGTPGRRIWYQYWDSLISNQRSYFARLRYVHENAVRHGIVRRASNYPWCSASWFERIGRPAFRNTVLAFPCDRVRVPDPFPVSFRLEE